MPFGIGWPELLIVLVIVLVIFGAKKVPEIGRALGKGIKEFRTSVEGKDEAGGSDEKSGEKAEEKSEATSEKS